MKLGAVATGKSFYNREREIEELFQLLKDDHLVMSGPRRLGKSSILQKLVELASENDFRATIMDLQGEEASAEGFIHKLEALFPNQAKSQTLWQKIKNLNPLKNVKSGGLKGAGMGANVEFNETQSASWKEHGDYCLKQLSQQKLIILIDEFSVFMEKFISREPQEAQNFLGWLRAWRTTKNVEFRFLFTGSIGLQSLLEMHDLAPEMNDCYDYQLGPFKKRHAIEMLQLFSQQKGWLLETAEAEFMCKKIGWLSPFFSNLLLNEAVRFAENRFYESQQEGEVDAETQQKISHQDIIDGYEQLLSARSRFSHWVTRLKDQFTDPKQTDAAKGLLSAIAQQPSGLAIPQLAIRLQSLFPDLTERQANMQHILLILQEQGYLTSPDKQGRVDFLSFLIKDYWRRNHVDTPEQSITE